MEVKIGSATLIMKVGDIVNGETDAIVNAANSSLTNGSGVNGAIHEAGGPEITEECRKIREEKLPDGLSEGESVITKGGNLKARYVIHTLGPVWNGGSRREAKLLENCYLNSLKLAESHGIASISFPSISTGTFGYPIKDASVIAVKAIHKYLTESTGSIREVRVITFTDAYLGVYEKAYEKLFS